MTELIAAPSQSVVRPPTPRLNARVLLVDDDHGSADIFELALRRSGYAVTVASTGAQGLETARGAAWDCLIVDLRLPDMSGIDVVHALDGSGMLPRFVVISAWLTTSVTVQMTKLGAVNVLDKPLEIGSLIAAVETAVRSFCGHTSSDSSPDDRSVAGRWSRYVLKGCESAVDPCTLELWARESAVSYSTLCEICRLNGLRPIDARDFVRVLRALRAASASRLAPETFLSVGDRRTLRCLSIRAGLDLGATLRGGEIANYLRVQQFIASDSGALQAIRKIVCEE